MTTATTMSRSMGASASAGHANVTSASEESIMEALAHLGGIEATELKVRWRELFGRNPSVRLGPELMKRAIAYRLQVLAYGGLSRTAKLRLRAAATYSGKPANKSVLRRPVIKTGTRFVREWNGEFHEVLASGDGYFNYRGKAYRSLSVIAREITGTHQSGPRFFGLNVKPVQTTSREAPDVR